MPREHRQSSRRNGSVYIAVLGTALIASVLALSALGLQRIQNRQISLASDIRQAQLNAEAAIELGLLTMKQNSNWRTDPTIVWPTNMDTGAGTCSLEVTQIGDSALLEATGWAGPDSDPDLAMQKVSLIVDSRYDPHDSLRNGSTAQPSWNSVFNYYQSIATAIEIDSLGAPQLARNGNLASTILPPYWTGDVTGIADDASIQQDSGSQTLRVYDREGPDAGAAQLVGSLLKPNTNYTATIRIRNPNLFADQFRVSFYANPNSATAPIRGEWSLAQSIFTPWTTLSVPFTTPNWTEAQLANAIVIVQSRNRSDQFYVDDLSVTQDTTDKYIYRQLISGSTNPYGTANANGIYYINCNSETLVIERSRIVGTLVIANPGANSRIGNAPINWAPVKPGYPALLVNGNFQIWATNTDLSEVTHFVNYNPSGTPNYSGSPTTDTDIDDTYAWSRTLRGLVAINGNLTYQNTPRIVGRVIVSGTPTGTANFQYQPDSLFSPPPQFRTEDYAVRQSSVRRVVD
jgi:hypothetical protein